MLMLNCVVFFRGVDRRSCRPRATLHLLAPPPVARIADFQGTITLRLCLYLGLVNLSSHLLGQFWCHFSVVCKEFSTAARHSPRELGDLVRVSRLGQCCGNIRDETIESR